MYAVNPNGEWPIASPTEKSSAQTAPIGSAARACAESQRPLPAQSASAVIITPRLHRKRKLAQP